MSADELPELSTRIICRSSASENDYAKSKSLLTASSYCPVLTAQSLLIDADGIAVLQFLRSAGHQAVTRIHAGHHLYVRTAVVAHLHAAPLEFSVLQQENIRAVAARTHG